MKRLILFFTRHKIVFGLFVLVFLIVLSRLVHHPEREYVKPLEKMLIERYGDRGLTMERAWFDEDSRKVFRLDLAVSKELAESKDVMKVCYEVQELIADYTKKKQEHFSLNDKEEFSLSFYIGKKGILPRGFYLLKFTNENAHRELSKDRSCKYENDFVRCYVCEGESDESNRIERKVKVSELSCFEKMQVILVRASVDMNDLQTLLALPQLKCLRFGRYNKTDEIEKNWKPLFKERGIDLQFDVITD